MNFKTENDIKENAQIFFEGKIGYLFVPFLPKDNQFLQLPVEEFSSKSELNLRTLNEKNGRVYLLLSRDSNKDVIVFRGTEEIIEYKKNRQEQSSIGFYSNRKKLNLKAC